jgi:hypothetical protein
MSEEDHQLNRLVERLDRAESVADESETAAQEARDQVVLARTALNTHIRSAGRALAAARSNPPGGGGRAVQGGASRPRRLAASTSATAPRSVGCCGRGVAFM